MGDTARRKADGASGGSAGAVAHLALQLAVEHVKGFVVGLVPVRRDAAPRRERLLEHVQGPAVFGAVYLDTDVHAQSVERWSFAGLRQGALTCACCCCRRHGVLLLWSISVLLLQGRLPLLNLATHGAEPLCRAHR